MSERRRFFSQKEANAVYLAADGKSDKSGEELGELFHTDHRIPVAAGGITDLLNADVLTPEENLEKSCRNIEPRGWQKDFIARWNQGKENFLLAAVPGSGKTIASIVAAQSFLDEYQNGRIIIIVPSDNLRSQWRDDAWGIGGLSLQTKEFRGTLKNDFVGVICTYQNAVGSQMNFRAMCARHPVFVIFDEVHHAGDDNTWGDSIRFAFEAAKKRLLLSGTPFRTNGTMIPWVNYGPDGCCIPDFSYDYPAALLSKPPILRTISFHRHSGRVEYAVNGEIIVGEVAADVEDEESQKALRRLLSADNTWVKSLLRQANERLEDLRTVKPDSGGLVLCIDSDHAMKVGKVLQEITGVCPDIVLCDDGKANSSVKSFRKSNRPWIVSVRQVSEGVDIKRLMVLCYLTNMATELFFRQAIGRIVRHQNGKTEYEDESYCYIPDDPRLVRMAQRILDWQVKAIRQEEEIERKERQERDSKRPDVVVLGTSEAEHEGIIIDGESYVDADSELIRRGAKAFGVPESKAAGLLEMYRKESANLEGSQKTKTTAGKTRHREDIADDLRSKIKKETNRLHYILKVDHKDIHKQYLELYGIQQKDMTVEQLKRKLEWLQKRIIDKR